MSEFRDVINRFSGEYAFLNNFYFSSFEAGGYTYPTVEHYFQCYKTFDLREGKFIFDSPTPRLAKQRGSCATLRPDWEEVKNTIMHHALRHKFQQNKALAEKLLKTRHTRLVEGNTWHDNYWGICFCGNCRGGKNYLGRYLELVRQELPFGPAVWKENTT